MKFNELTTLKNLYLNKKFEGYLFTLDNNQWIAKRPLIAGIIEEVVPLEVENVISKFKDIKGDLTKMQELYNSLFNIYAIDQFEELDKKEFIENCMLKVLIHNYCEHNDLPLFSWWGE